ncbi:MAG TPA: hypothetical protein PKC65_02430 [Pyrinomonadaceae bacterium]|nr:hypothetical protein [Pyrinomonadaceae bacterium]
MQLDANGLPILDQFSGEGFVDLVFRIVDFKDDDERFRFHLTASHKGNEAGLNVEMVKGIQGGLHEDENEELQLVQEHVYHDGVEFSRSGEDSDELISILGSLYELTSDRLRMVKKQMFTAIALHEGDVDFDSQTVNIKLFCNDSEDGREDDYFECFFNVDFATRLAYWNEKDQEYRDPLLRGLSDPSNRTSA